MSFEQSNHSFLPPMIYGSAWKEKATQRLVFDALQMGFRGIDTANQRKHYFEEGVGLAIQQFLTGSQTARSDVFIQTKFTSANGQDHRKPYDAFDSLTNQVKQSFASSLHHLQTDYIDSYILHGPTFIQGIAHEDLEIWQAMEMLVQEKKVTFLGISNVTAQQLEMLYQQVSIKPTFVQNRCFAARRWDQDVRLFCQKHQIIYQGFSLLTANQSYILSPYMQSLAIKYAKTIPQITFRFALQMGILPLTGTTDPQHMREDLAIDDFELSADEIHHVENGAGML